MVRCPWRMESDAMHQTPRHERKCLTVHGQLDPAERSHGAELSVSEPAHHARCLRADPGLTVIRIQR